MKMKMQEAMDIINSKSKQVGYMVSFEEVKGGMLHSGYFPDKHGGEDLISTIDEAWDLARRFANKTVGKFVNIYVVNSSFTPVDNYKRQMIINKLI